MEVTEIKSHIQLKTFKPFYIFAGDEWKIQHIYVDMISKVAGKQIVYADSIQDIYRKLDNRSLLAKSFVYVLRDDKELMQNEKLQEKLERILRDNILILLISTVDKRTKFYKAYKDTICEFEPLKPEILSKYIQKEIKLSKKNCERLMEVCEYDYGRCLLEIDKIKNWQIGYGKDKQELMPFDGCLLRLLNEGIINTPPKDAIFEFVDAILDHKVESAFNLYQNCLAVGEATMVMISVLYNNAKAVLQVKNCSSSNISKSTGLTDWQVQYAKKHTNALRNRDLINIMRVCQQCQQAIVTGEMEEEFVMDYILTEVL